MRQFPANRLRENSYFMFRAEAYNALNTPQFSATTVVFEIICPILVGDMCHNA
jgi:hypothetical protein